MEVSKNILTVFTPTYNRAYTLPVLYESLKNQTNKSFIWLIVDDGSTDNTEELVEIWKVESEINMVYCYQNNAGKMQAHNKGVGLCRTEMFVCVDSDDYLVDDAVECLIRFWEEKQISKKEGIAGIIAKKGNRNGEMLGQEEFPNVVLGTISGVYEHIKGDTTLCFKTEILKNYKFPFISDEKFIIESYIYIQMDQKYKYYLYPEILTICEYRSDGYTQQGGRLAYTNPIGSMYFQALCIHLSKGKNRIIAAAKYNMYKIISKHNNVDTFAFYEKIWLGITFPIGIIFAIKKKRQYGE